MTDSQTTNDPPLAAPTGSVKLELLYNGDYPGYPVIRMDGHWLDDAEERLLCRLFGVDGPPGHAARLKTLFAKLGAEKINGSFEHMPWDGTLTVTASQNSEYTSSG